LPANNKVAVIMIGAGSGIAPLRGFWQEREAQMQSGEDCGKMFLFFGCRNSKSDNIYSSELNSLLTKGVLHDVFFALSREPGCKKVRIR
jgi:NADPH-ferrihemoprotein reductase